VTRVEFHPEAQNEFASAARFYENQRHGLGLDFTLTIQRTYERLLEFPTAEAPFGRRLRRVLVPKFPTAFCTESKLTTSTSSRSCTFTVARVTGGHGSETGCRTTGWSGPATPAAQQGSESMRHMTTPLAIPATCVWLAVPCLTQAQPTGAPPGE
jgi:hypothetical protein